VERFNQINLEVTMKVLLVWEEVPERTILYSLTGPVAELAIKAAGQYVEAGKGNDAETLAALLPNYAPIGNGESNEAFNITDHDKVVIAGLIM
jgi:hypothetical protein